ncbi:MAG: hypothetical protein NDI73_06585 [Desulfuromonadales bacterium]|nr:hypothetical protein [Desulfuromonadales bacterium]
MTDIRHEWDHRINDWPTIHKIAHDLGLAGEGHHFYCPGCQPLRSGSPELAIREGTFECFRCGTRGDVVGLVKLARKCALEEAIAWLENETGGDSPP